ncbi:uncharacterized protein BDR25DRAFT_361677 [Lindgomyces ingoldianus]|uniref:Uncharacterized protein n=1 Tax=Lindgomyces ingoldianus TaxID=673940 RepID=A0ACB6QBW9_9PLEO|nr:uncharacterized protein BDR25DRAFT_361677 [Lindgomyces ingoldianus]KAF2464402.1 hypothetical protein BDR25DRAFT_361677 [Lindgomyces ingoldianus]
MSSPMTRMQRLSESVVADLLFLGTITRLVAARAFHFLIKDMKDTRSSSSWTLSAHEEGLRPTTISISQTWPIPAGTSLEKALPELLNTGVVFPIEYPSISYSYFVPAAIAGELSVEHVAFLVQKPSFPVPRRPLYLRYSSYYLRHSPLAIAMALPLPSLNTIHFTSSASYIAACLPGLPTRRSTVRLGDFEACTGRSSVPLRQYNQKGANNQPTLIFGAISALHSPPTPPEPLYKLPKRVIKSVLRTVPRASLNVRYGSRTGHVRTEHVTVTVHFVRTVVRPVGSPDAYTTSPFAADDGGLLRLRAIGLVRPSLRTFSYKRTGKDGNLFAEQNKASLEAIASITPQLRSVAVTTNSIHYIPPYI